MSRGAQFETIRTEGGLLPADLLQRVRERDKELGGLRGEDYGLPPNEPLNEAIVRSYNRLVGAWGSFRDAQSKLLEADPGTTVTRERWLLVLLQELGYGRVQTATAVEIEGASYAVTHGWGNVPIHLVGCKIALGTRTRGVAGAATKSPHATVQELLNRSDDRLWGIVSNGLQLRVLRDNSTLTRQAYLEFDLEQMMDGDVYPNFALLWMLCHASRVEGERPHECWLEKWSQEAAKQGTRALEGLRNGVEEAVTALGSGFLAPGRNAELKAALRNGDLATQDYYRELLRLVYRLLFLFVAEDRGLLHHPDASEEARGRFARWYSTQRLRQLAEKRRGTKHGDLWESLMLVMRALGSDEGSPPLGLPPLGSFLWSSDAIVHLEGAQLPNRSLLEAVRSLATVRDGRMLRGVDYKNLGAEELGSVYESLLELHPELDAAAGAFTLTTAAGHERKTTGSYYTPTSLINVLLDSALDPVLDEAAAKGEGAILDLKVCDPACGSGHFLVAASHRIAKKLASVRTGEEEPAPEEVRRALRDVVSRCLYGVDLNPMAVELCKISLWLEALDPGRPLSFLDAHVKQGNSLLGTTSELLSGGLPDDAFKPLQGDDKEAARSLKAQNKREREGQLSLDDAVVELVGVLEEEVAALEAEDDATVEGLHLKEQRFRDLAESDAYERAKLAADAWCAAFVQRKEPGAPRITTALVRRLSFGRGEAPPDVRAEVDELSREYGFFHWEIEFPQVFGRAEGGFDCVLGNPPWDQAQVSEKEFFSKRNPEIASAVGVRRKALIAELRTLDPELFEELGRRIRLNECLVLLVRAGGRFPLCGRGKVNLYAIFAELMVTLAGDSGRAGSIVPAGIATDDTTKEFFVSLVEQQRLRSFLAFDNREFLFPDVKSSFRFGLLTVGSGETEASFVWFAAGVADLTDPDRRYMLTADEIMLLNPNTRTSPVFRSRRDADLNIGIYQRVPVLVKENDTGDGNAWAIHFSQGLFNTTTDSGYFRREDELAGERCLASGNRFVTDGNIYLPLLEAKMIARFDHRAATYEGGVLREVNGAEKQRPEFVVRPRYWVDQTQVDHVLRQRTSRGWLAGWQDITDVNTMARSVTAAIVPRSAVADTFLLMYTDRPADRVAALIANLSTFIFDYTARQKIGGIHLKYHTFKQLPVLAPNAYAESAAWDSECLLGEWIRDRVVELVYTSADLVSFGEDLGADVPFRWQPARRELLERELDAGFFHLYGLAREDVDYVMETFPIVRRKDEQAHGEYRTKRLILEIYDDLAEAIATSRPYQTRLDPPPADPRVAHPPREETESVGAGAGTTE